MSFEIDGFDLIEFDIPAGKDKKITLSVPPFDCILPSDSAKMTEELEKFEADEKLLDVQNPTKNAIALARFMLKYFNPGKQKADAIDALVTRQVMQIDAIWSKESGIELGESSPSTDESSETDE